MSKIDKSVIILAGGKATRLNGFPKSHLLFSDTETFIEKILKEVRDYKELIISSNNEFLFKDLDAEIYDDEIKNIGPIGGLYTCLKKITTEEALVIGVNMPYITREFLSRLGEKNVTGHCIVPIYEGDIQPLCGIYSKKILPLIERHIEYGDYDMKSLVKESKACYIAEKDNSIFLNINTFEEYYKM